MKNAFSFIERFVYESLLILSNNVILNSKAFKKTSVQKQFLIEIHIDLKSSILNLIQISLIKLLFLASGLQKRIALVYLFKADWGNIFLNV